MSETRTARFARGLVNVLSGVLAVGAVLGVAAALVLFTPGNNAAAVTEAAPAVTTSTTTATTTSTTTVASESSTTTTTIASDVLGIRVDTPRAYRVGRGQSLDDVASEVGVSVDEILALNGLPDASLVEIGTVLLLPAAADEPATVPAVLVDEPERAALGSVFDRWAEQYNVPSELAKAVAWHESEWNNDAADGGVGIGQLDTALYAFVADSVVGIPLDPTVPAENIHLTVAYLGWLLDATEGDTLAALAAYDQGLVSPRDLVWDEATVEYLSSVLALRPVFD
ncbi:MAG: transglycosylase SLT domain-containing protein, partial [Acidimicrobiia bacterium]|nr:transglycosylase SLT domain-containing protein [Acidimicrobiia bacterium]